MYVSPNLPTKKAIKDAIAKGTVITVFQPNDMFGAKIPTDGTVTVEGPHYPKPHRWYGQATLENGRVVKIR
jgi:hypothetical protein